MINTKKGFIAGEKMYEGTMEPSKKTKQKFTKEKKTLRKLGGARSTVAKYKM
jgi:hypothetical protein